MGGRNFTTGNQKLVQVIIDLKSPISKDSFSKKIYNKNDTKPIIEGEKIVGLNYKDQKIILNSYQFVTLDENQNCILYDYSNCINSLVKDNVVNIEIGNTMTGAIKLEENNEQKDLFNLLMPYAVSEETNYSHITLSYRSATSPSYGTCFSVEISAYDENTNSYVKYQFMLDDNQASGKTAYERIVDAVDNNDFYYGNRTNKEMISGDIMLEMEKNQDVYKIITIQEAKDIANLLMPHAVGENSYSLVSVGYENDEDPSFGAYFCAEIYAYNKDTKSHIKYRFIIKDSQENGKTEYQRMVDAVNKNNFTYTELSAELGTEKE